MDGGKSSTDEGTERPIENAAKRRPDFEVIEVGGDRCESLEAALAASLDEMADAMVQLIMCDLETGKLIVVDGKVKFPEGHDVGRED